jgi:hypothetical protein
MGCFGVLPRRSANQNTDGKLEHCAPFENLRRELESLWLRVTPGNKQLASARATALSLFAFQNDRDKYPTRTRRTQLDALVNTCAHCNSIL